MARRVSISLSGALCAILLAWVALAPSARACLREIPLEAQLIADARAQAMQGFAGNAKIPPFLLGHLSYLREAAQSGDGEGVHGAVLFVQESGTWRAFLLADGESTLSAYVSSSSPLVIIVTHLQIEGPGQSFTVMRSTDGLRSAQCAILPFPKALNRGGWKSEYLELRSLQLNARGKGRLIASALLGADTDRPQTRWWRYRTRNGAKSWSRPRALPGARAPRPGVMIPIPETASPAQLESLASFAKGR